MIRFRSDRFSPKEPRLPGHSVVRTGVALVAAAAMTMTVAACGGGSSSGGSARRQRVATP